MKDVTPASAIELKDREFARQYILDFNPVETLRRCKFYPKVRRRSTLSTYASKWLEKDSVQQYIQEELENRKERVEVTQDAIIDEYAKVAFSCITDYLEWDENGIRVKPSSAIGFRQLRAIDYIEMSQRVTNDGEVVTKVKFKLNNKLTALEALGKSLGMFAADNKHEVNHTFGTLRVPAMIERPDWDALVNKQLQVAQVKEVN